MSEPLAERLSRFTPDGSGLDRDALLFAAGRASVRPGRGWAALVGALAACQLLTLTLLWSRPPRSAGPLATAPPVPAAVELPVPLPPHDAVALGSLNRWVLQTEGEDLPPLPATDALVPDDPPLRASASPVPAGLD